MDGEDCHLLSNCLAHPSPSGAPGGGDSGTLQRGLKGAQLPRFLAASSQWSPGMSSSPSFNHLPTLIFTSTRPLFSWNQTLISNLPEGGPDACLVSARRKPPLPEPWLRPGGPLAQGVCLSGSWARPEEQSPPVPAAFHSEQTITRS